MGTSETSTTVATWLESIPSPTDNPPANEAVCSQFPPSQRCSKTSPDLQERGRKRKRTMSNPSIISQRPILTPRGPSTQRSRSQSPVRNLWRLLARATPAIHFKEVGEAIPPEYVLQLKKSLFQAEEKGVIPEQLKDQLKAITPSQFDDIHKSSFGSAVPYAELQSLWASVKDIYKAAESCQRYHKDENEWIEVVRMVFRTAKTQLNLDMLELTSIQTQTIDPRYLSTPANSSTPIHKKADLALCFTPDHDKVAKLRNEMGDTALSQMTDAYTEWIPMACGIEVKEIGGNRGEAMIQYGVWAAAGLAKVNELVDGATLPQPLLGWTVVGHDWMLHISWKLDNGEVVICGPWEQFNATTRTYEGIFKLLHLIARVGKWLQEDYWTWFSNNVIVGLSSY